MIFVEDFSLVQAQEQLIAEIWIPGNPEPLAAFHCHSVLSRYYAPLEVGDRIGRKFDIFQSRIAKEERISIKRTTLQIEQFFSVRRKGLLRRRINLDPGYLTLTQLVLAATKDHAHRIDLEDAV